MDTDFTMRMFFFEHESHEFHESFWHTDGCGWTRIYRAEDYIIYSPTDRHRWTQIFTMRMVGFEHEFHEYFFAHRYSRMDTDFTVRTIGYHKDTQEADKLVLPTLGGDRGGR